MFTGKTDEELIDLIGDKDHDAFTRLVRKHTDKCYSIAYRMVFSKNDAEDIVQEAFLKIWDKPWQWDKNKKTKFTTWFYAVILNLCVDLNRKRKGVQVYGHAELPDTRTPVEDLIEKTQIQKFVDRAIKTLPERQEIALSLCFYENISNKEAAEIMGINLKTIQSLVFRAKVNLREKIMSLPDNKGNTK